MNNDHECVFIVSVCAHWSSASLFATLLQKNCRIWVVEATNDVNEMKIIAEDDPLWHFSVYLLFTMW